MRKNLSFKTFLNFLQSVDHIETPMCDAERCFAVRGEDFIANITLSSPEVHHELISENIVFILGVGINLPMEYPHDVSQKSN